MNALKALQQKIKRLEIEREQAEANFESLEKEKEKCRGMLTTTNPMLSTQSSTAVASSGAVRPVTPRAEPGMLSIL